MYTPATFGALRTSHKQTGFVESIKLTIPDIARGSTDSLTLTVSWSLTGTGRMRQLAPVSSSYRNAVARQGISP